MSDNAPTQPDQAEGERKNEGASKSGQGGVSTPEPAEGGDDAPARGSGSPRG